MSGIFINIFCAVVLMPGLLTIIYYIILAVFALAHRPQTAITLKKTPYTSFAILIPAHNEEKTINIALNACLAFDYPRDKFAVFVIADNCTDQTAGAAIELGITCLERHDDMHRGKGHALEWGLERILPLGYEAIVVLDADCHIDPNALLVVNGYICEGKGALQINNLAANPDSTSISYAVAVGNIIENELFYAPKSLLGLAVFLGGTGMVLHRDVLINCPWRAFSIAEDIEYTLNLLRKGVRIHFVPETRVLSDFPTDGTQLKVQRTRWSSGNLSLSKGQALALIGEGLLTRNHLLIDAGWTLLVLSRPLILMVLFSGLLLSAICFKVIPGFVSASLFFTESVLSVLYIVYFGLGAWRLGITARRVRLFLTAPVVVLRLMLISIFGLFGLKRDVWARTPRN